MLLWKLQPDAANHQPFINCSSAGVQTSIKSIKDILAVLYSVWGFNIEEVVHTRKAFKTVANLPSNSRQGQTGRRPEKL